MKTLRNDNKGGSMMSLIQIYSDFRIFGTLCTPKRHTTFCVPINARNWFSMVFKLKANCLQEKTVWKAQDEKILYTILLLCATEMRTISRLINFIPPIFLKKSPIFKKAYIGCILLSEPVGHRIR